MVSRTAGTTLK